MAERHCNMALLHFLSLLLLYTGLSGAFTYENITVIAGQTLILSCPVNNVTSNHMEWKSPHDFLLFFNRHKGLKDNRFSLLSFSDLGYTITLSKVNFQDGGLYKCLEYTHPVTAKIFKVTVIGQPKLEMTEHEGRTTIKCSAEANFHPPKISWMFENELLVDAHPQHHCDSSKCSSLDILLVRSYKKRTVVKCIVHHKSYNSPLINFVTIGDDSGEDALLASTLRSLPSTGISKYQHPETTPGTQFTTDYDVSTPVTAESTSENISINTNASMEENQNGTDRRVTENRAPLLIFLVTCLIFGLVVVVIFFAIKLRRAHALWKKENEDTDQSLESNKSKSSHEEKQSQERRGHGSIIKQGLNNTYFTKYTSGESAAKDGIKDTENPQNGRTTHVQVNVETHEQGANAQIKETEL